MLARLHGCIFAAISLLLLSGPSSVAADKKLIEFGWDEPGTQFLREHIDEMKKMPFDGCVFHADAKVADGQQKSFTWAVWGHRSFSEIDLRSAFDDLQQVTFGAFKENFLRFNATPGDVD